MTGATLDTGALIAFERGDRRVVALVARALERNDPLSVPTTVIAQAWRDGRRQARLQRLLASEVTELVPLDDRTARAVGQLCGVADTSDIVDASVVLCALQRDQVVVTSDADDLRAIAPNVRIERV